MSENKISVKIYVADISSLTPTEENPRQISKRDFEKLKKSLIEFPEMRELREVVIDENNRILGGHQRVKALEAIGETKVIVKQVIGLPEEKKNEFVIKDNIANGEWDMDILTNAWSDYPLDDWGLEVGFNEEPVDVQEDEAPEADEGTAVKLGDIYELGNHRLMCGDSAKQEDIMALMNGDNADLYLTDPPYNVNYEGATSQKLKIANDNMDDESFRNFLTDAFASASSVMKAGASFYVWHADSEGLNFRIALKESGFLLKQTLIWNKNALVMGRQDYQWKHEPCLYGWKEGTHSWYGDRKQTTVIDFDRPVRNGEHPTMKPVGLFAYQIKNSSKRGDIVLDSFGGSGTAIMACEQLGRRCYTMELDPRYVDVIIRRWENTTGKKAKLVKQGA